MHCFALQCHGVCRTFLIMPSCAVPGCDGGTASSYQPFPKSGEDDRTKWFTALGLAEDGATDEDDLHVCSRHFKISDFVEKGVVRRGAVPCMRLTLKSNASPTRPSPPKKRKKSTSRELDHLEASNVIMDEVRQCGREHSWGRV